ncbi:MAG: Y-family DNA polymerase [Synechococcaceae cyanobacterium]|nr:Y-family DNA polymerase [Synechococcaceae cyanobacterium]
MDRTAVVLIDANNFYASCEAALDPSLAGRPLVVLSNNDGCIVARSAEARALGIAMGTPFFQVRGLLERHGVLVRSSNYTLYGDMSQRLMATLEAWVEELEIYSIDEAFGRLCRPRTGHDLSAWGEALRAAVRRELGLSVAVGIAPSKVLAKLANRIAKHHPERRRLGVFDLGSVDDPDPWLAAVAVEDVWGIGRRLARWCRLRGVRNARELRDLPAGELHQHIGVVGLRLQRELQGIRCLPLLHRLAAKQETCVSRSFRRPLTSATELREAVATYLSRAAEKLRQQHQCAGAITVFVRTSPFADRPFYSNAASVRLALASDDTGVLLAAALPLVERLFRPHQPLQKAGVLLQELQPRGQLQHHLLLPVSEAQQGRRAALMATVDALNHRYGRGAIQWAACGLHPSWTMRRSRLSRAATTRLEDLPVVRA